MDRIQFAVVAAIASVTVVCGERVATAQLIQTNVGSTNIGTGFGPPINPSRITLPVPGGRLSIFGGQSSSRSIVSQSASVTTMDGVPGSIVSQQLTPFVTGVTPVVGGRGPGGSGSGSGSGLGSVPVAGSAATQQVVRRISESAAARQNATLQRFLRRAELGQRRGNVRMMRANYRSAMRIADPATAARIAEVLRGR